MPTFERSIEIAASREALFDLMQDYDRRLLWDPFLSEARLIGAERAGLGVRCWCVDHRGRGMETEYVSFDRPARVAVRMTRGPWVFRKFAGSWIYEDLGDERTRVRFKYHVESRLPLWRLGDWALTRFFAAEMDKRLAALKEAVDNGSSARAVDRGGT